MSDQVLVKRLFNCFGPTSRYIKRRSALTYLNMFKDVKKTTGNLTQFDEKPECNFHKIYSSVVEDTITDSELHDLLSVNGIPELGEKHFVKFIEIELPKRATEGSAGYDLHAAIDESLTIEPGEYKLVPTGLSISMPKNLELQVRPRSGLAAKYGITVLNAPGTVDSDYGGEIKVILINHGKESFTINRGDRIAQAVFNNIALPDLIEKNDLEKTTRGSGGFGSTGVR